MKNTQISAAVLALGLLATVIQVVLVREALVVFGGNEIVLGLFFGAWFFGIAAGARVGVPVARRFGDRASVLGAAVLLLGLAAAGSIVALRLARQVLEVPAGGLPAFAPLTGYSLLVVAPVGLVVGLGFPLASRILEKRGQGNAVGTTYWIEGIGAVIGGLVATFLLVPYLSPLTTVALTLAVALVPVSTALRPIGPMRMATYGLPTIILLVAAIHGDIDTLDDAISRSRWQAQHHGIERMTEIDTPYAHVGLGRLADQYTLFSDGEPVIPFPDEYAPPMYAHLAMCQHPAPKKMLILGGVVNQLVRPALAHQAVAQLVAVELDPRATELVLQHQPEDDRRAFEDERVTTYVGDGRLAVNDAPTATYDLIVASLPPPQSAKANRFYTREFFTEARNALKPDGVLAISLPGAANYLDEATAGMVGSVFRSLTDVFPHVVSTPEGTQHHFASMSDGVVTTDLEELGRRWESRGIQDSTFTRHHFLVHFPPDCTTEVAQQLRQLAAAARPNTDSFPRLYFFGLVRWSLFSGSETDTTLAGIADLPGWVMFLPLLLYAALRGALALRKTARNSIDALVAVGASGFAGLTASLVLLYAFQVALGSVYQDVGLLVAAFMAGLSAGGAATTHWLTTDRVANPRRWLGVAALALGLYSLVLGPLLEAVLGWWSSALPFLGLALLAGALVGMVFPLASRSLESAGADVVRSAGLVDAADHLGAMAGGLCSGVILLPLLGLWGCCGFAALACVLSGIFTLLPVSDN